MGFGDSVLGSLAVCGISYNTATLSEREPFQITRKNIVPAVKELQSIRGVKECMILSTCNRFEAYMVLDNEEEAFTILREFFILFRCKDPKVVRDLFYVRHGSTVVRHLFRVTAGLDSMVLGEYQIQNQVKEAYSVACSVKGPGKILHKLVHAAFRAGKTVRTRTAVGAGRMSVAGMAVGMMKNRLAPSNPILMVGVNENIRIVAEGLRDAGFTKFLFANRTTYKADKLATRFNGEGYGLDDLKTLMSKARCIVSCTGAPGYIIPASLVVELAKQNQCPELFLDLAVPRDIETPNDRSLPVEILDLEDLKGIRNDQLDARREEMPAADSIVEDMVCTFQAWMEEEFDPGVGALVKEYDRIRQACLNKNRSAFNAEDREALDNFSRMLMHEFLKVPASSFLENPPPPPSHRS
ncbi:MAG: glutamyl-tRNA reductase [Planctomycetota bacterium]